MRRDPDATVPELTRATDVAWAVGLGAGAATTLLAAAGGETPRLWLWVGLLTRASLYAWADDALRERGGRVLGALLRMGLIAGAFELLVDWALVRWVPSGRLVYLTGSDVVLLESPVWMPLAWACVIVELGYPGLRLLGVLGRSMPGRQALWIASVAIGVAAGVLVGFYEYLAAAAGWWRYEKAAAMLGEACALYIPLGEVLMFTALPAIALRLLAAVDHPRAAVIAGGVRFAAMIAAGYGLAWLLLEAGRAPR